MVEPFLPVHGNEEYLRMIIDSSPDGITVVDEQGRFEFVNDSFCRIIGWPEEEIIGHYYRKIIPEDECNFIIRQWRNVREGVPGDFETKIMTKGGEIKYIKVAHTLSTINGKKKIVSVTKDITDFKKRELDLKESEAKYRELFENADDPMYTHDLEGRFLSINKIGLKLLGGTEEEVIGSNVSQWLTKDSYNNFRERVKKILAGQPLEEPVVIEVICKNGEHKWGDVRTRLIRNEDKIIVHGIARDITENMKLKQELNKSNKQRKLLCYLIEGTRGGKSRALILRHLVDRSYNAHQLAKLLSMDYKTIRHHLEVLVKNGIITKSNDGYTDLYFLSKNVAESLYSFSDDKEKIH
ncbi:Methyl sulfide methyltransferase-associated sensor [uncultured archaeon]|nr:Methyl sulfide methyltransferase-associated sensor [uncultured archaeon]